MSRRCWWVFGAVSLCSLCERPGQACTNKDYGVPTKAIAFVSNHVALSVWVNFGSVGGVHHVLIRVIAIL